MMVIGFISVFIMGLVANKCGRKWALIISQLVFGFSLLVLAFIPTNYYLLLSLFCLTGFYFPIMANGTLYLNEIGNARYRNISAMSVSLGWGVGEMIFIWIGYVYRSWRV